MSASERLKALDFKMPGTPWRASADAHLITAKGPDASARFLWLGEAESVAALRNALPQIVAVVEQAEYIQVLSPELSAALTALEEALS